MMRELSILIPARNEIFLARTIQDILEHIEADTEIIAVLDGEWTDPPIPQHERVNVIYVPEAIGQRASTNLAAKLSTAKYVMKVDAHCSFEQGFDRKMIEFFKEVGDDVVAVPIMRNLWAFDWKCYKCGWKTYQGRRPSKCGWIKNKQGIDKKIGGCDDPNNLRRKMIWIGKERPKSMSYCFDSEPHFQYFEAYRHREPYISDRKEKMYTETMSLQGSLFMSSRQKYWEWELCDESLGNWGNQGLEVACAAWLSGGRVLVNHNTWYAHMFRTQGGDFGFPWDNRGSTTETTKNNVKNKFWDMKHPKQIHPVSWLIEKFSPVTGWSDKDLEILKLHERNL